MSSYVAPLEESEISAAVDIFLAAFSGSVRKVYGDPPKPAAITDVWSFVRCAEPGGFVGAHEDSKLVGYAIFTESVRRLQRKAVFEGKVLQWVMRALSGRYGIVWRNVLPSLWNKLLFVGSAGRYRTQGDAQLLNIAVSPAVRGRGFAKSLVQAGLAYLAMRHVPEVRLEVRPDNQAAIRVYLATGFVERGRTRDAGGEWLVMTATL